MRSPAVRGRGDRADRQDTGAAGPAETPRPSGGRGSGLFAPPRWLGRKLSGLVRWAAKRLRAALRPVARLLVPRWLAKLLSPLRWLGRPSARGGGPGFGFWWLVATLAVAIALGLVVALLLTPVAGLIALLVMAIWALVRRHRSRRRSAAGIGALQGRGASKPRGAPTAGDA